MSLIKWNNFDDTFPSLPAVLEDFFGRDNYSRSLSTGINTPAVNIKEEDDKFLVTLAVPGVKKEDIKLNVQNGMLTVSSEKKDEKKEEKEGKYSRYEYNFSSFSRSFSLPDNADAEYIKAKYEDGELKIELQKKEKTLSAGREIQIE
jgi:HSP20 family protein